jgi:hypothetical protein
MEKRHTKDVFLMNWQYKIRQVRRFSHGLTIKNKISHKQFSRKLTIENKKGRSIVNWQILINEVRSDIG